MYTLMWSFLYRDLVLNELTQLPEGLFDNTTQLQEL